MTTSQKITPCLWFVGNATEAVEFYLSVFPNGRIVETNYYSDRAPMPKGSVLTILFEIGGLSILALNAPPHDTFNDAVSLQFECETQEELDEVWQKLTSDGGKPLQCGWLKDKFGFSWQITPRVLTQLLRDADEVRSQRIMDALMEMVKLDIAALQAAYDG